MEHHPMPGNVSGADSGIESNCNRTNSSQQTIPNSTDSDATSAIYTIDTNQESNFPLDDLTDTDQPLSSDNHPQLTHQLSDCSSTFEFVDFQSPISYADGGRSNSSTLNEQESITDEPSQQSNANHHEPIIRFADLVETNPPDDNNKMFRRQLCDRGRLSSKEEKQRQNEEIVILESSSVSSESGSWDPVFPQRTPSAVNVHRENLPTTSILTQSTPVPPRTPEQPNPIVIPSQSSTSSRGACFIDASSLLDDTEVAFSSLNCLNVCETSSKLLDDVKEDSQEKDQTEVCKESEIEKMDLKLETGEEIVADLQSPNLSDEQKLFHRVSENRIDYDIKDQFASDSFGSQKVFTSPLDDRQVAELSSKDTKDTDAVAEDFDADYAVRQEQERKQGNFLFKNSIQHYSQTIQPNNLHSDRDESDMSLPSIYSTNSEPCNDYGQNYETSSQYSSNFGDTNEYGHAYSRCLSEAESGIYPDTPHNSIVNVDSPRCFSRSDNLSQERSMKIPKKPFKCDESAPIVSGGASIEDFTPKLCESPSVRRKTETCPILSGGLLMSDFEEEPKPKALEKPKVTPRNAWVVDMSDCKTKRNRSGSSSSSITDIGSTDTPIERSGSCS